jgi:hypothetical protein
LGTTVWIAATAPLGEPRFSRVEEYQGRNIRRERFAPSSGRAAEKAGQTGQKAVILAVLNSGKPGDDLGMANRLRPLVKITRPSPSAGDRYELRDVDTDRVLASIRVTTLANPLSHVDAICHLAQLAERRRWRLLFRSPPRRPARHTACSARISWATQVLHGCRIEAS